MKNFHISLNRPLGPLGVTSCSRTHADITFWIPQLSWSHNKLSGSSFEPFLADKVLPGASQLQDTGSDCSAEIQNKVLLASLKHFSLGQVKVLPRASQLLSTESCSPTNTQIKVLLASCASPWWDINFWDSKRHTASLFLCWFVGLAPVLETADKSFIRAGGTLIRVFRGNLSSADCRQIKVYGRFLTGNSGPSRPADKLPD